MIQLSYKLQTSDIVELPCHFFRVFPGLHQVAQIQKPAAGGAQGKRWGSEKEPAADPVGGQRGHGSPPPSSGKVP